MHQHATLADTVYFWFGSNDTDGSGNDGATPVYDVRLAGAAAGAAPVMSGSATLLSHANYPAGCHEVAIVATVGNGFAANNTYAVFCTLLVDSQNPTGFVGSFTLGPVVADLTHIHGTALTETSGQLAGRFVDFFDQATATFSIGTALSSFQWGGTGATLHADYDAAKTAAQAGDEMELTAAERNSVADAVLNRAAENIEDTADKHSLGALIMFVTNYSISGSVLTAKKPSDDSTFQTYVLASLAGVNPVTGVS